MRKALPVALLTLVFVLGSAMQAATALEYTGISGRIIDAATGKGPADGHLLFSTNAVNGGLGISVEGSYTAAVYAGVPGSIRVYEPPAMPRIYHGAWYGGAGHSMFAKQFVAGIDGLSGIDIVLNRLGSGSISGSITGTDGLPVRRAWVVAYEWCPAINAWDPVESLAVTGRQGEFVVPRLNPGTYRVGVATDLTRDIRWYVGGASLETATSFTVANAEVTGPVTTALDGYSYTEAAQAGIPPASPFVYNFGVAGFHGQMIDAATGAPIIGDVASNWFTGWNGDSGPDGNFTTSSYQDTWATLIASASGYRRAVWYGHDNWEYADWALLGQGDSWGYSFVLNRPGVGSITGTLSDLADEPVEGRRVVPYVWAPKLGIWDVVDSDYFTDASGQFVLGDLPAGRYRVAACWPDQTTSAYWSEGASGAVSEFELSDGQALTGTDVALDPENRRVSLVAGVDRYATAAAASRAAFPGGATEVVLVTGANWPDALAAAGYAGSLDAALLPVQRDRVPPVIMAELQRLKPSRIRVVGGRAAVADEVIMELNNMSSHPGVDRLGASNRYATARAVGIATIGWMGSSYDGKAYIATGKNFPDALAISPLSYASGRPLYLLGGEDDATIADMKLRGVKSVTVIGSTSAITATQEAKLVSAFGRANVSRVFGADRFSTGAAVAKMTVATSELRWDGVAMATGYNYPDALIGGVLAARHGTVLLLTGRDSVPSVMAEPLHDNRLQIESVTILGGDTAISPSGRAAISRALR